MQSDFERSPVALSPSIPLSAAFLDSDGFDDSLRPDAAFESERFIPSTALSLSHLLYMTRFHHIWNGEWMFTTVPDFFGPLRESGSPIIATYYCTGSHPVRDSLRPASIIQSLVFGLSEQAVVVWIGTGSAFAMILLCIAVVLILMKRRRPSSKSPTEMSESVPGIVTEGEVWATLVDPYLSEENALSRDGRSRGEMGWLDDAEENLLASARNETAAPISE
jgi:hypothetical protein